MHSWPHPLVVRVVTCSGSGLVDVRLTDRRVGEESWCGRSCVQYDVLCNHELGTMVLVHIKILGESLHYKTKAFIVDDFCKNKNKRH